MTCHKHAFGLDPQFEKIKVRVPITNVLSKLANFACLKMNLIFFIFHLGVQGAAKVR